jgi:hypothetical protein
VEQVTYVALTVIFSGDIGGSAAERDTFGRKCLRAAMKFSIYEDKFAPTIGLSYGE